MVHRSLIFLIGSFIISLVVAVGCVYIIVIPTDIVTTNAAFALLGVIVQAWLIRAVDRG